MTIEWLKREQETARRVYKNVLGKKFDESDFNHYSRSAYLLYQNCRLPANASEDEKNAVRHIVTAGLYHRLAEEDFHNYKVRNLLKGLPKEVTKLASGHYELWKVHKSLGKTRNLKDFMEALVKDPRIWLIHATDKTDRLLNPPKSVKKEELQELAEEIHTFYAPLFHKLGLYELKNATEDRAFEIRNPYLHSRILEAVRKRGYTNEFVNGVEDTLSSTLKGFGVEVVGRPKRPYSIAEKMKKKGLISNIFFEKTISEKKMQALLKPIGDLSAFRIIVPEEDVKKCYQIRDHLEKNFFEKIIDKATHDYIAHPKKYGNYQSIHLVGYHNGKKMEVQIRTFGMHENAEHGNAAHWGYKGNIWDKELSGRLDVFREILEGKNPYAVLMDPLRQDSITVNIQHGGKILRVPFRKGGTLVEFVNHFDNLAKRQKLHGFAGKYFQLKGANAFRVEERGKLKSKIKWLGQQHVLEDEDFLKEVVFSKGITKPSESLLKVVKDPDLVEKIREDLKRKK